jgi:integrase
MSASSSKDFKVPKGVEVRKSSIRIAFTYKGVRRKELITKMVNQKNINYAGRKRAAVCLAIEEGTFDYEKQFPKSPFLEKLKELDSSDSKSISTAVKNFLKDAEVRHAPSTYLGYKGKSTHILEHWPTEKFNQVSKQDLRDFQYKLLKNKFDPKTVNDVFTILRAIWEQAEEDGEISQNPLTSIKNLKIDSSKKEPPTPFEMPEMEKISALYPKYPEIVTMHQFTCWTGLSVSESIGLSWEDFDDDYKKLHVQRAFVENEYKVPKEVSRDRQIDLLPEAQEWIKKQVAKTKSLPSITVQVRQRDNITHRLETITPVFNNPNKPSERKWSFSSLKRAYTKLFKEAGVTHRGANQCRHTYASRLLSAFVPLEIVATTLGHSDTTMVKKRYGKWIKSEMPDTSKIISGYLEQAKENSKEE